LHQTYIPLNKKYNLILINNMKFAYLLSAVAAIQLVKKDGDQGIIDATST